MTPSPPDEALHFRGKTLTPESPRPLHIPEPSNIPVLENQMDPVFNDTATYQRPEGSQRYDREGARNGWSEIARDGQDHSAGSRKKHTDSSRGAQWMAQPTVNDSSSSSAEHLYPPQTAVFSQNVAAMSDNVSSTPQPMDPGLACMGAHYSYAQPADIEPQQAYSSTRSDLHPPPTASSSNPSQSIGHANGNMASAPREVNLQILLDNLSQQSATAKDGATLPAAGDRALDHRLPSYESVPSSVQSTWNSASGSDPPHPHAHQEHPQPQEETTLASSLAGPNSASSAYVGSSSNLSHHPSAQSCDVNAPGADSGETELSPSATIKRQQSPLTSTSDPKVDQDASRSPKRARIERQLVRGGKTDDDQPWGPEVQKKYDEFLHQERVYVTEGLWDRFPMGSRLFVGQSSSFSFDHSQWIATVSLPFFLTFAGNLPTERVTKRDMFHIFHKYGKLAQISIKQAYGFIQFVEATACHAALQHEQGAIIRGRKIHLEISKPQRSTARAVPAAETSRAPLPRRSRSPDYGRAAPARGAVRAPIDRYERPHESSRIPFSDFRDEASHRRRDDYRPPRSPSPRPSRARDGYRSRDRTPERFERRERRRSRSSRSPRSPYARDRRYRSSSPRHRNSYEGEAELPVPRRAPRDVPEVQVLVLEEIDRYVTTALPTLPTDFAIVSDGSRAKRNFVLQVENAFRNRGLRVDVLVLGPRIPLGAAVQRQFVEGVLAVVRLSRSNQFSRKIPLQIFDRSAGPEHVRFTDYPELDPSIAAEVMFHQAQAMQRGPAAPFAPHPAFGAAPMSLGLPPPSVAALPNAHMANLISTLDGPALHSLLSALQQRPGPQSNPVSATQSPFASPNPPSPADLATLLSNTNRAPPMTSLHPPPNLPPQQVPHQPYALPQPNLPMVTDPNLLSLLAKGLGVPQTQAQPPLGSNVQNLMHHFSKWKQ
ncbi:hypothetical protein N7539_001740 [Penicillium diatomitis]|uniref:RRM domain-containing protein n=1 Tax=Penicillium diatomitis TaxID=2819901 RepID=A0A9W9XII2_9EURO|nr:uncharacterized protein N7539_001740 [Penicillium diatomitis]KAJ5492994.1 hypothetical protein N7539_001740 [Penicillium diatomitis]